LSVGCGSGKGKKKRTAECLSKAVLRFRIRMMENNAMTEGTLQGRGAGDWGGEKDWAGGGGAVGGRGRHSCSLPRFGKRGAI
jgi:hypothetical protein